MQMCIYIVACLNNKGIKYTLSLNNFTARNAPKMGK